MRDDASIKVNGLILLRIDCLRIYMKLGRLEDEVLDERGGGVEKGSVTEFW